MFIFRVSFDNCDYNVDDLCLPRGKVITLQGEISKLNILHSIFR